MKYLVEQGADIHADDDCALRWACDFGYLEIVKFLIELGADCYTYDKKFIAGAAFQWTFGCCAISCRTWRSQILRLRTRKRKRSKNRKLFKRPDIEITRVTKKKNLSIWMGSFS